MPELEEYYVWTQMQKENLYKVMASSKQDAMLRIAKGEGKFIEDCYDSGEEPIDAQTVKEFYSK